MNEDTIVNVDALSMLKGLEANSVDLVLTDPPYAISKKTTFVNKGMDKFHVTMDFGEWDQSEVKDMDQIIAEIWRVLRSGGTFICFYDVWKLESLKRMVEDVGFSKLRAIEWLKSNPVPLNSKTFYLTNAREMALCAVKGGGQTFNSEYDNGVYSYPICQDEGRFHPTQKPLELFRSLIQKHTNGGDLVVDCFSGSGTTAVAASQLGRRFICSELDEKYWERSVDRLKSQGGMAGGFILP